MKTLNFFQNFNHYFIVTIPIFLFLSFIFVYPSFGEIYYVSSSTGADTNDGLTTQAPFKTLNKISNLQFLPGDSILFKRGDTWNESLKFRSSGSPGYPITIGAYSNGNKPRITGVTTITNWTQVGYTGIYYVTVGRPYGVYEDGVKIIDDNRYNIPDGGNIPGNPTLTGSGGDWYFDTATSRLYYSPTSGLPADHIVQYSSQVAGIWVDKQSYINIENIEASHIGISGIYVQSSDHININNVRISYTFEAGIQIESSQGYVTVTNSTIFQVGDGIYFMEDNIGPNLVANNTISYCNYVIGGSQYNNNDGHAIGLQNGNKFVVRDNTTSYSNMSPISPEIP